MNERWPWVPLKRLISMRSGRTIAADAIEEEGDFPVYGANGVRGFTRTWTHEGATVLIGRQGALCGNIKVAHGRFFASEHALVVRPQRPLSLRWLAHLLEALDLGQYSTSAAQPGIGVEVVSRVMAPFPDAATQQSIADHLDRETARIDELIAEQEALIVSLAERRGSVISRETNGDERQPFGRFMKMIRQGWSPNCEAVSADGVREWGVLKAGCARGGVFRPDENKRLPDDEQPRPDLAVREDEVVMSRSNTRDLVGVAARVPDAFPKLLLSDLTYGVTLQEGVLPRFAVYALGSEHARGSLIASAKGTSASMQKLSQRDIKSVGIWVPSREEQRRIVEELDEQTARIDELTAECRSLITLLKERRSALITAAVTGQLDVSGLL